MVVENYESAVMAVWAKYSLGIIHLAKGDYAEAAEFLGGIPSGTGMEIEAMASFKKGRALQKMGKSEEAMAAFLFYRSLSPQGVYAQRASFRAAEIARQSGRGKLAASLYHEALSLGGDDVISELSKEGLSLMEDGLMKDAGSPGDGDEGQ